MPRLNIIIWLLAVRISSTIAIIAYDCQDDNLNITTYSLVKVGKCQPPQKRISVTNETIQLLQLKNFEKLPIIQCKIHVTRLISHCGMHSHMSAVTNGIFSYLYPITLQMCTEMHKQRSLSHFYGKYIDNLIMNGTTYANVLMAGKMKNENTCEGADYEDTKGSWSNVIVQAALEITLNEHYAVANVMENRIELPGGTTCSYNERTCIDSVYGYSYWEHTDNSQCSKSKYNVVYEGPAKKLTPINNTHDNYESIIYLVDTEDIVFGMPILRPTTICGQTSYETDHPSFFIIKASETGTFYFNKDKLSYLNIDPTAYTNSKFVFLEKHIRGQVDSLYAAVMAQKCQLEQQVLRNLQILAIVAPAEFAFARMNAPGYTAVTYGEVVHIIRCTPVEVSLRYTGICYHEAPISYNNQSMFMAPRTQIIQKYASEVDCNTFLYPMYQFGTQWYKVSKGLHETIAPQLLSPNNQHDWKYKSPTNLFKGGLYSREDMEALRQHLLLPNERQALTGIMTRGMIGVPTDMQGTSLTNLIDENTVTTWLAKSWALVLNWFMTFGTVTAGFMGLYLIAKVIKFLIDTVIHGVVLYDIFGFSLHLLGALFDSITMFWVHRNQRYQTTNPNNTEDVEEGEKNDSITISPVSPDLEQDSTSSCEPHRKSNLYPKIDKSSATPRWLK